MTPVHEVHRIAGFDMGRQYIAWSTLVPTNSGGWEVERHGILYPPLMGNTEYFGSSLDLFRSFFQHFLTHDLDVAAYASERFIKMMGSAGSAAEDVNLLLGQMTGPNQHMVRNVDWKRWFKAKVHPDGAPAFFATPTEHEADASGIGLYLGAVLLPRRKKTHALQQGR
jgi:hypothetical protein